MNRLPVTHLAPTLLAGLLLACGSAGTAAPVAAPMQPADTPSSDPVEAETEPQTEPVAERGAAEPATPTSPRTEPTAAPTAPTPPAAPSWATCERYERLLAGDRAAIQLDGLEPLPWISGASVRADAPSVSPRRGRRARDAQRVRVEGTSLEAADGERIFAWILNDARTRLAALSWAEGDRRAVLRSYRVGADGLTAMNDAATWSPPDQGERRNLAMDLYAIGDTWVIVHVNAHTLPGGCAQYSGYIRRRKMFRWTDEGLVAAGRAPREEVLNGSDIGPDGQMFYYDTQFADVDGDGDLEQRIRPLWSTNHDFCGDTGVYPRPRTRRLPNEILPAVAFHRRFEGGRWVRMEGDHTDLLLANHARAVRRTRAGRDPGALVALGNLVTSLEAMNPDAQPRDPNLQVYSLQHWLYEAEGTPGFSSRPNEARFLTIFVGAASMLLSLEGRGNEQARLLRRRLAAVEGDLNMCDVE